MDMVLICLPLFARSVHDLHVWSLSSVMLKKDVGSGYGATILLAATLYPNLTSVGIEWFGDRVEKGLEIKTLLENEFGEYLDNCSMIQGDFVNNHGHILDKATHVWAYDVAYHPEKTIKPILERLARSDNLKSCGLSRNLESSIDL